MYPEHIRYYLGFNLAPGLGPARLARLLAHCGSLERAWHADAFDLAAAGVDARTSAALIATRERVDLDREFEDAGYPRLLREIPGAPLLLYVRGALTPADEWAVAVVGTRSPTAYGREAARHLAGDLARAGITIVSGLALGIDAIAHTAALEAGGRTVAVLGCGVDRPYPERHRELAERIIAQGALVSDYPLGALPAAANFPPRNRIISGLSHGTLVVEAGARSGALITVEFALEQGRDVLAVPGSIFSRQSEGCLQLLRNGAALVASAGDVLAALDLTTASAQSEARIELPADPVEAALLAELSYEPRHIDELGRAIELPAPTVAAALALLELKGLARQAAPMQYVRAR
jgi:DNA processing protein